MHRSYSVSDQPYAASFQAIQNLGLGNGQVHENGTISPPENDQEHIELLQRIQSAIPDINRLLHGFRHTHTRLNSREAEIKQIGNQHEQALMHKDFYIEALQSQMKKTANESAEECAKLKNTINELRLELGDLQEKQKDLEDGLAGHQKSNEELSQSKSELEAEIEKLNTSIKAAQETHEKELETQKEEYAKALTTQKQELTELFEEIKNEDEKAASETLEAREKDLRDQLESTREEWGKEKKLMEDMLESQRGELEATKAELASKIASLETKEAELETQLAELSTTRDEVASKVALLEAKEKELEDTRQKSAQELEALQQGHVGEQDTLRAGHTSELDSLHQTHEEQLAAAAKDLNEKIAAIEAHFLEQEQHWEAERAALQKLLAEKDEELSSAEREKDKLEGDGLIKEQQLQRAVEEMRSTIDHLGQDCDRLRRTLQSLGEATDLKTTKGDQFL
jgi:chromosome segregation ATPase